MIEAAAFWRLYYSADLNRLQRDSGREPLYSGVADDYSSGAFLPADMPFEVDSGSLRGYDYERDPRFYFRVYDRFESCLSAVLGSPLMDLETIPHWREMNVLMQLLRGRSVQGSYAEVRTALLRQLSERSVDAIAAAEILTALEPTRSSAEQCQQTGDTIYLGVQRDILIKAAALYRTTPLFTRVLVAIVQNPFVDIDSARKAIWAIGRQNDKDALGAMIEWLRHPDLSRFSVDIERALQFQLSGSELIPLSYDEEYEYWRRQVADRINLTASEWAAVDSESALWEKRMRMASDAESLRQDLRTRLALDEVSLIRRAVGREPATG